MNERNLHQSGRKKDLIKIIFTYFSKIVDVRIELLNTYNIDDQSLDHNKPDNRSQINK